MPLARHQYPAILCRRDIQPSPTIVRTGIFLHLASLTDLHRTTGGTGAIPVAVVRNTSCRFSDVVLALDCCSHGPASGLEVCSCLSEANRTSGSPVARVVLKDGRLCIANF